MPLERDEAWEKLCEWTPSESLRKHARSVELVMRQAAHRYGAGAEDEERFGLAGLLHDADYERWPEEHPRHVVAWLRDRGESEMAHAISAHYTKWGVACESTLDRALLACDELSGFVVACCLVRPEGIRTLTPKSVRKKLKDKGFAAKVERDEVRAGAELLGVELADHIQFVVDALKPHHEELGIGGHRDPGAGESASPNAAGSSAAGGSAAAESAVDEGRGGGSSAPRNPRPLGASEESEHEQ